ncbi:hypothetical protein PIB30_044804 [Stylosanthes scabra]|uniref:Uncharacterized protein n=1 Tax=Stylosanthes scabra TaxID=79078 RepID=A0ABU6UGG7_9FABA|nr:hypothetical protein [Stylosanthes scabra]
MNRPWERHQVLRGSSGAPTDTDGNGVDKDEEASVAGDTRPLLRWDEHDWQSSERKWLKRARGTRRSQRKAKRSNPEHLQEDNTVALTHNFYDATTIPPYNKQYYTQGGRHGQLTRWNPPQQPQAQPRQPYTYNQPQNRQNPRYQPPHNRQQYLPSTNSPFSLDEAIHTFQRENQEMREAQKRTES